LKAVKKKKPEAIEKRKKKKLRSGKNLKSNKDDMFPLVVTSRV